MSRPSSSCSSSLLSFSLVQPPSSLGRGSPDQNQGMGAVRGRADELLFLAVDHEVGAVRAPGAVVVDHHGYLVLLLLEGEVLPDLHGGGIRVTAHEIAVEVEGVGPAGGDPDLARPAWPRIRGSRDTESWKARWQWRRWTGPGRTDRHSTGRVPRRPEVAPGRGVWQSSLYTSYGEGSHRLEPVSPPDLGKQSRPADTDSPPPDARGQRKKEVPPAGFRRHLQGPPT